MSFMSWLNTGRQCLASSRSLSIARSISTAHVPKPQNGIATPADFLKAIGRQMETKYTSEDWDDFWKKRGPDLKEAGVGVQERRYLLWCMKKYKTGEPIAQFAHEPRPKKTIRGWGPAVQNGKRLRSRVEKSKNKAKARAKGGN